MCGGEGGEGIWRGGGSIMWGSTGLAWGGNQVRGGRTGGGSVQRNDQGQCVTSTETIRLIRDGGMEVGKEGEYIPIATLSPPE